MVVRLSLVAIGSVIAIQTARAWEPIVEPARPLFTHNRITHSADDPEVDALISRALTEWGERSSVRDGGPGPNIVFQTSPDQSLIPRASWPDRPNCLIRAPKWRVDYNTILHEVGHCLGLWHSTEPSVMRCPGCQDGLTEDDHLGISTLYPPGPHGPYRTVVGNLTREGR